MQRFLLVFLFCILGFHQIVALPPTAIFVNDSIRKTIPLTTPTPYSLKNLPRYTLPEKSKFNFSLAGGGGYMVDPISSSTQAFLRQYSEQLKYGYIVNAAANWCPKTKIEIGLMYTLFSTSNQLNNVVAIYPNGTSITGYLRDNILIQFIAPTCSYKITLKQVNITLVPSLAVGYLNYRDNATVVYINPTLSSATIGGYAALAINTKLTHLISVGISGGYLYGTISSLNETLNGKTTALQLPPNTEYGLNRIDLTLQVSRYF